ncbi:LOW QUALITY PROTEIN: transient receptor potential cation channel subfamily V member 5-like [Tachypleus tridentatus]|uniref:LOW QUALITY PROTEIN: transient receptor potential cation channel subfamily V member 5-like n=1 Tax=Tachypleus tridentatus TaxID=6853 RepID=UPI003FD1A740
MGNTNSNVTSGVKKQADTSSQKIYSLVAVSGGGELVTLMKEASRTRNYAELDERIRELVEPFLYNKGEGRMVPIRELVMLRNQERPRHKQLSQQRGVNSKNSVKGSIGQDDPSTSNGIIDNRFEKCREVCWDLSQCGSVGETILHLCLLMSTSVHAELAKRLIRLFPKLVNDIYISDEFYGESVLHMAIVNEDPAMVKVLLDSGANYHERCVGNFFCPEDQKASRMDSLDHEWVDVVTKTNYEGYVYWGEYPLCFAACLGQEECYRLLLAKGADPNRQDTNGNTITHIMVIYEKINMFNMVYELGASINIVNRQGLTPLTLAAKLAKKEIFFHILKLQREIYWQLGKITCEAYPLDEIDTINNQTGEVNKASVLNLVVYGDKLYHLDMLEGLLIDLLHCKWNTFVKFRFYKQFATFAVYFLISLTCFVLRPAPLVGNEEETDTNLTSKEFYENGSLSLPSSPSDGEPYCLALNNDNKVNVYHLILECLTIGGAFLYLLTSANEARLLGYQTFLENLVTVPSRVLFLLSCSLVMLMVPLRLTCTSRVEDVVGVFVMITTAPYFLFFCRGFKLVGPFVVMIYKMIVTDLLRFVTIYLVFVMGFSQAFYVIFLTHNGEGANFFGSPVASVMAMFVMSLAEFGDIYEEFENTAYPTVAKILFIMYMALVTILLINMLIAMMGKTYQNIAERRNEWVRQWARIVLVVERGMPASDSLKQLSQYSQPMADGRRALVLRRQRSVNELEEIRVLGNMKALHLENRRRQEAGSNILSPKSTPVKTHSVPSL